MDQVKQLPFSSLGGALRYQAQTRPDKTAVLYADPAKNFTEYASLTYKEFNNITDQLALQIDQHLGTISSSAGPLTCAIFAMGGIEYLLSQYALLKLTNVIMFPISAHNSPAAVEHLLRMTKTVLLLTISQFLPMIRAIQDQEEFRSLKLLLLNSDELQLKQILDNKDREYDRNRYKQLVSIKAGDETELNRTIMIFHSSGSTAFPKPIYLSNRFFLLGTLQYLTLNKDLWEENDVIVAWGSLCHMLAFDQTIRGLLFGCTYALPLCVTFPPKPEELVRNVHESHGITVIATVPSLLEQLIHELVSEKNKNIGLEPLRKMKFVMYGGAACPDGLCKMLVENGTILISGYGSTETGVVLQKNHSPYDGRWWSMEIAEIRKPYLRLEAPADSENPNEKIIMHLPNDPFLADDIPRMDNGCYVVGDIILEDPPNSGQYTILGRQDDILVHINGEKTNPIPIENTIRHCSVVQAVVVVGHNQFSPGAIIQLNAERAAKYSSEEIEQMVWFAIQEANEKAPSHSTILRGLFRILLPDQTIPVTHKGNLMRRKANQQYATLISTIFDNFYNDKKDNDERRESKRWTLDTIKDHLKKKIKSMIPVFDCTKSLFDSGINSLQIIDLRNWICREICEVPKSFAYEYSSIDRMSDALASYLQGETDVNAMIISTKDPFHYQETEEILEKFIDMMKEHRVPEIKEEASRVFLLTGSNGSLGNFMLRDLLRRPSSQVKAVYCLLRGSNLKERLFESFEQRGLDASFFETHLGERLIILPSPMDLRDQYLGQTSDIYQQLEKQVTDIVHCAWKVNFNLIIKDFVDDNLVGLYQLLKLAIANHKQFHFISSIASAASGLLTQVNEEPLPRNSRVTIAHGYGQSKYIAEHLCWEAMNIWKVPVNIYRVGQISGDTEKGVWNATELLPMMIYAGAGKLKKMPNVGREVRWIPVDVCSESIIELALKSSFEISIPVEERVHHLINPHQVSYSEYLQHLQSAGLEFDQVSPREFLDTVLSEKNRNNPLMKLATFLEQVFEQEAEMSPPYFETLKTQKRCQALHACPPVDQKWIESYLNYWRRRQLF